MSRGRATNLVWIGVAMVFVCASAVWIAFRGDSVGRHPIFGPIRQTLASDVNDARPDPFGRFLRRCLPPTTGLFSKLPYQFKDGPRYLRLGRFRMEWSLGGWFYFHEPNTLPTDAWEFAPSSATNLLDLAPASMPACFYGRNDTNLQKVLDPRSNTNALHVREGQVLFARHAENPGCVFALHLFKEDGNRLIVRYCTCCP